MTKKHLIWPLLFLGVSCFSSVIANDITLTLKESIDIALENNPIIIAEKQKLFAAGAKVTQAFSGFLPTFKIEGGYSRSYQKPITFTWGTTEVSFYPDESADLLSYQATLTQNLFTGGKLTNSLRTARIGFSVVEQELRAAQQELVYKVIFAYYEVLRLQELAKLNQEALNQAHLQQAETLFNAGVAIKGDVLRAKIQLAKTRQEQIRIRNALKLAKAAFNSTLGRRVKEEVILKDKDSEISQIACPDYEELLKIAYQSRPDWVSFVLNREISEHELTSAYSGYLPDLLLTGTAGRNIAEYPRAIKKYDIDSWSVTGTLSWTIFDGLNTSAKIREAVANLKEIGANERKVKDRIALEVEEAHLSFINTKEQIEAIKSRVAFAKENLRISILKYESGKTTNIEVIDAQEAYNEAENDFLEAQFDYKLAQARINLVTGVAIF